MTEWIRPSTLFGPVIPREPAQVIARAIRRAIANDDCPKKVPWIWLEHVAADYLAGPAASPEDAARRLSAYTGAPFLSPPALRERLETLAEIVVDDAEVLHVTADMLLVNTLRALGYGEAMDVYDKLVAQ